MDPLPPDRALAWVLAGLAARNLGEPAMPGAAYVPAGVGLGAALVRLGRAGGASRADLGLDRGHLGRGLAVGIPAAAGAAAGMAVAATVPATGRLFDDERVPRDAGGRQRAYQVALRIPVGTVAFEELAFRGVLLGLLGRRLRPAAAVALDSALFGLWHVVPTLATARVNGIGGRRRLALVAGAVVATAAGGAVLCGLRMRAGHVVAPALVHLAFNDAGYLLAGRVRRRRPRRRAYPFAAGSRTAVRGAPTSTGALGHTRSCRKRRKASACPVVSKSRSMTT